MQSIRHLVAVVCLPCLVACSTVMTSAPSGFLSSYAGLTPSADGASASVRSTALIDPARLTIGDIEWRASNANEVTDGERRVLLDRLRDDLIACVRELPAVPDGRAVVLRAAITHVETVSPALNAASALLFIVPLDRGGASVDIEALDAGTGTQVAALTLGYFAPLSELKSRFSKLAPASLALRKAANEFGALLRPSDVSVSKGGS